MHRIEVPWFAQMRGIQPLKRGRECRCFLGRGGGGGGVCFAVRSFRFSRSGRCGLCAFARVYVCKWAGMTAQRGGGVVSRLEENWGVTRPWPGSPSVQTLSCSKWLWGWVRAPAPRPACQAEKHPTYRLCLVRGGGPLPNMCHKLFLVVKVR